MFFLEVDEDISLRILDPSLAKEMFVLIEDSRSTLRRWLPWVDANITWRDTKAYIDVCLRQLELDQAMQMGIWYRGTLVGVIGYYNMDRENRNVSIGYWMGEAFHHRGIMTRTCQAMVRAAFFEQGLNRVEIRVAVGNWASRAIPERLGFVYEGRVREGQWLHDQFVDVEIFSILAKEWPDVVK